MQARNRPLFSMLFLARLRASAPALGKPLHQQALERGAVLGALLRQFQQSLRKRV